MGCNVIVRDLDIAFSCPSCKHENKSTILTALEIDTDQRYIGSGESVPVVSAIWVACEACSEMVTIPCWPKRESAT